jgi:hypothetical protein
VPEDLIKDKLDEKSRKKEQIEQAEKALEKIKEFQSGKPLPSGSKFSDVPP